MLAVNGVGPLEIQEDNDREGSRIKSESLLSIKISFGVKERDV